jgi:hypothetical protein
MKMIELSFGVMVLNIYQEEVCYLEIVDMDEAGYYTDAANRKKGHSAKGVPARKSGRSRRTGKHITVLAACDARVGIVSHMEYSKGTTKGKFYFFIVNLITSLYNTGRRIITMDNLSSHFGDAVSLLENAGHIVIFRPKSSPDFGPIEWVFNYLDRFLQFHSDYIDSSNFEKAIEAALDLINSENIVSFMANAHFAVPNHTFDPYMGQQ